jgi:hypothetical protein
MKNFDTILSGFENKYNHKDILGRIITVNDYVSFRDDKRLNIGIVSKINPKSVTVLCYKNKWNNEKTFGQFTKFPEEVIIINDIISEELKIQLSSGNESLKAERKNRIYTKPILCAYHNIKTNECGFIKFLYSYKTKTKSSWAEFLKNINNDSNVNLFVYTKNKTFENLFTSQLSDINLNTRSLDDYLYNVYLPVVKNENLTTKNYTIINNTLFGSLRNSTSTLKVSEETAFENLLIWYDQTLFNENNKYCFWNKIEIINEKTNQICTIPTTFALDEHEYSYTNSNLIPAWNKFINDNNLDKKSYCKLELYK